MEGVDQIVSKSVDEKVVQMKFDNSNFEAKVQQSLNTLDKLKSKLNFQKIYLILLLTFPTPLGKQIKKSG